MFFPVKRDTEPFLLTDLVIPDSSRIKAEIRALCFRTRGRIASMGPGGNSPDK
jgi:hypothetical protein